MPLFRIDKNTLEHVDQSQFKTERELQRLVEASLGPVFKSRFVATEFPTGLVHGGRIDTLALSEDDNPVIIEYKRSVGENVINQGLYYLDWLMDHQAEFKLLVLEKVGKAAADAIDWSQAGEYIPTTLIRTIPQ